MSPPWAVSAPQLLFAPHVSSGRAWRLWAARYSWGRGAQSLSRGLEIAVSKVAHFTDFDHLGRSYHTTVSVARMPTPTPTVTITSPAVLKVRGRGCDPMQRRL